LLGGHCKTCEKAFNSLTRVGVKSKEGLRGFALAGMLVVRYHEGTCKAYKDVKFYAKLMKRMACYFRCQFSGTNNFPKGFDMADEV